jgi:uncharacterized protein YuzE
MKSMSFNVKLSVEKNTGRILAAYFRVREGKVAKTLEFANGNAFADYNAKGELLGIEQLGPCDAKVFNKIAAKDKRIRDFLKASVPPAMAIAG